MPRRKLPYNEGDAILVPLKDGRYCRGVVGRSNGRGKIVGFYFAPALTNYEEALSTLGQFDPDKAVLIEQSGDLGLLDGSWKVLGPVEGFSREKWPLPKFLRLPDPKLDKMKIGYLVTLDERTLYMSREEKMELDAIRINDFWEDGLSGAKALEVIVSRALGAYPNDPLRKKN